MKDVTHQMIDFLWHNISTVDDKMCFSLRIILKFFLSDPPCKNGITMMDYAEQKVCGEILKYFLNNSVDDTCS